MIHFTIICLLLWVFCILGFNCDKTININGPESHTIGQNVSLNCSLNHTDVGVPLHIDWKVPGQNRSVIKGDPVYSSDNWTLSALLTIQNLTEADEGNYTCNVMTKNNSKLIGNKTYTLLCARPLNEQNQNNLVLIVCCVITASIISLTCFVIKRRMFRNCLNGDSGVEGQLDLIPDVIIFDFPKLQLKLGKELGLGKFSVVYKADAIGMINDVTTTTVSVKMAKSNTNQTHINALRSELDIMNHIGMHLNIVNLLGAYTGSINKKLMMITEYCRFGNIHHYLSRQRNNFINQITPSGIIDFNIHIPSRNPYCSNKAGRKISVFGKHDVGNTQIVDVNEYLIPGETKWYMNYRGDYESYNNKINPSCTYDLVCWSLQIARGMEYVAMKNIYHFNLTTRSILLAEGNIVKICDFETSRIISDNEKYKRMSSRDLAVKWLAIESLRDGVYLSQSNIWTYGIVLWEIFSLAATPYPSMGDKDLLKELVKGYRLRQPPFADKYLYKIMLNCWKTNPLDRPSFKNVAYDMGRMLTRGTISYLANLNDNYTKLNDENRPSKDYSILIPVTSSHND